jgi:hypothetical protein
MANESKLQRIHDALADWCLGALEAVDPATKRPLLTAAEANTIRAFLKDNEITAGPGDDSKITELREKLAARRKAQPLNPALDGLGDGLLQ